MHTEKNANTITKKGGVGAGRVEDCEFLNNLIVGNTSHKKAQAEVWIQWAANTSLPL